MKMTVSVVVAGNKREVECSTTQQEGLNTSRDLQEPSHRTADDLHNSSTVCSSPIFGEVGTD